MLSKHLVNATVTGLLLWVGLLSNSYAQEVKYRYDSWNWGRYIEGVWHDYSTPAGQYIYDNPNDADDAWCQEVASKVTICNNYCGSNYSGRIRFIVQSGAPLYQNCTSNYEDLWGPTNASKYCVNYVLPDGTCSDGPPQPPEPPVEILGKNFGSCPAGPSPFVANKQ